MTYAIHTGDNIAILEAMPPNSVHAIITDPPYGHDPGEIGWDGADARRQMMGEGQSFKQRMNNVVNYPDADKRIDPASWGVDPVIGGYAAEKGYTDLPRYVMTPADMLKYQIWCARWADACYRVLKPGGYMVSFGASRVAHRMAVGIEDGGFEIRDTVPWIHRGGAPTGSMIWKLMEKWRGIDPVKHVMGTDWQFPVFSGDEKHVEYPSTELGKLWYGWQTRLKPIHEPIVIARKPHKGTVAKNVLDYGVGALNVLGAALPTDDPWVFRWPPNVVLAHHPRCKAPKPVGKGGAMMPQCDPGCVVAEIEAQKKGKSAQFPAMWWELDDFLPAVLAVNKPSRKEKCDGMPDGFVNDHPTVKPIALMEWLIKLVAPKGAVILDPFGGSGTTGVAALRQGCHPVLIDRDPHFCGIADYRLTNFRPDTARTHDQLSLFDLEGASV